jgi:hypothetical protein
MSRAHSEPNRPATPMQPERTSSISRRAWSRPGAFFPAAERDTGCYARNLIFDLVTAVQVLVERRDDPETVKLTGICRNLIRCWAEL